MRAMLCILGPGPVGLIFNSKWLNSLLVGLHNVPAEFTSRQLILHAHEDPLRCSIKNTRLLAGLFNLNEKIEKEFAF